MATRQRKSPKKRKASFPRPKPKPKPKRKKPVTTRQSGNGPTKVPQSAKPPKPTTRERKKSSTPSARRPVRANAKRKAGVGKKPTGKPTVATVAKPRKRKQTKRQLSAEIERLKKRLAAEKKKRRSKKKKPPKKKRPPKKPPVSPPLTPPVPPSPPPTGPHDIGADVYDYFKRLERAQALVEEIICGKGVSAKTLNEQGEEYYLAVAAETDMDPRLIFTMFESPELFGIFC